jgi:transcriptional regulator with XRE-family HTH domain
VQLPRLREVRLASGYTQQELADQAGINVFTVLRSEQGQQIRPNTARRLAEVLGVRVADLLETPPAALEVPPRAPLGVGPRASRA